MSFPAYPLYRESGVGWLGTVPQHWSVLQIRRLSPVQRGASPRPIDDPKYFDEQGKYAWVRIADVSASSGRLKSTEQRLSELGSALSVRIYPGALFVSIAGTVGKPCISEIDACIHDGFVYFPGLQISAAFLYRIFEAGLCYAGLGKLGTQLNLNTDTIGSISIAVPPAEEMGGVLSFLDRETGKIDALVAEQERLIALLKEKRQAVISQAVTKGLDANVPMKDCGVEWLGEVPAHWEIGPLKRFWSVIDCKHLTAEFIDVGLPLASIREVQGRFVDLSGAKQTHPETYSMLIEGGRAPREGDLIYSRNATVGEVAQVAEWHPPFAMGQDVCLLRRREVAMSTDFLQNQLRSTAVLNQLALTMIGSTFKRVNVEEIQNLVVAMPPDQEQHVIAAGLLYRLEKLDVLVKEVTRAITLLQERRAALISAVVTGKIDVRDRAASEQAAA